MFKRLIACITLFFTISSNANPIQYGIIAQSHSTAVLDELRKTEVQALQKVLQQSITVQLFHSYSDILKQLNEHPNEFTLLYVQKNISTQLLQLGNWQKIGQLLEFDHENNSLSPTYRSYVLTAKKSSIGQLSDLANKKIAFFNHESESNYTVVKQLLDEHQIRSVQWIQAKDLDQALAMVATGKADALGVWGYYYSHAKDKNKFKILYTIKGLENPTLYGNTNLLSREDIKKIQKVLKDEVSKKHLAFSYN